MSAKTEKSGKPANPARRKAAAQWPPDPWLAHAPAKVIAHEDARLVLEGAASPVSGVRLQQSFSIAPDRPDHPPAIIG